MTRFIKTVLIASSLLIVANPALADWQFTKWGMTPVEVQKASPVRLESGDNCPVNDKNRASNAKGNVLFSSNWKVGNMDFIACYIFLDNKLQIVNLFSRQVDKESIIKGLSQRYGTPEINTQLQIVGVIIYSWNKPDEEITFMLTRLAEYPYRVGYRSKAGSNENSVRDGL